MKKTDLLYNEDGECTTIIELLEDYVKENKSIGKVDKLKIDLSIENNNLDSNLLYIYLKQKKEINQYGCFRLMRRNINKSYLNKIKDKDTLSFKYFMLATLLASDTANMIKGERLFIETWIELYDLLSIKDKTTQQRLKDFLIDNKLLRVENISTVRGKKNRFIINPFVIRNDSYISQLAVCVFNDFIEEDKNISRYSIKWLEINGY